MARVQHLEGFTEAVMTTVADWRGLGPETLATALGAIGAGAGSTATITANNVVVGPPVQGAVDVQDVLTALDTNKSAIGHVHAASVITFAPGGTISSTNVQAALSELDIDKSPVGHGHIIADVSGLQGVLDSKAPIGTVYAASAITNAPAGTITGTTVQAALNQLDTNKSAVGHTHAASAIGVTPSGGIVSTNAGAALSELDTKKSPVGHGHVIADVSGLQTALDAKLPVGTVYAASGVQLANGNTVEQELGATRRQANLSTDLAASGPKVAVLAQPQAAPDAWQDALTLRVQSVAALRALAKPPALVTILLLGYFLAGDGGGQTLRYDPASTATDDGGSVFASNAGGTGRYRTTHSILGIRQFGAKGDNSTNDTAAVQAALTWAGTSTGISVTGIGAIKGKVVPVPPGGYSIGPVNVPVFVTLAGECGPYCQGYNLDGPVWFTQRGGLYSPGNAMFTLAAKAGLHHIGASGDTGVADVDGVVIADDCRVISCALMNWSRHAVSAPASISRVKLEGGGYEGLRNCSSFAVPKGTINIAVTMVDSEINDIEVSASAAYGTLKDPVNKSSCALYAANMSNLRTRGCVYENADRGIYFSNFSQNCHIIQTRVELCNAEGIVIENVGYNHNIIANIIGSCGMAAANTYDWVVTGGDVYSCNIQANQFVQYTNVGSYNKPARYLMSDGLYPGRSADKANDWRGNSYQEAGGNGMTGAIYASGVFINRNTGPAKVEGIQEEKITGTAATPDGSYATSWNYIATGAFAIAQPINMVVGQTYVFVLTQDGVGGRVFTWNLTGFKFDIAAWSNNLNTAGKSSRVVFYAVSPTVLRQVSAQTPYTT